MTQNLKNTCQLPAKELIQKITNIAFYEFIAHQSYTIHPTEACNLLFIDYGEIEIIINHQHFSLKEGQSFLIPCETGYSFKTKDSAVNILMINFISKNVKILTCIYQEAISLEALHRNMFAQIIYEAKLVFPQVTTNVFQIIDGKRLIDPPIGSEELIYIYLSQLIIFMARGNQPQLLDKQKSSTSPIKKYFGKKEIDEIITFMEDNLDKNLSIAELSDHLFVSPSYLKKIFKKETGYSIINFYRVLKMERAKQWVRENKMNFTEISGQLGYDTLHHFSNSFKKYTGLSPTMYKKSIHTIETKLDKLH